MNTRILRMCYRNPVDGARVVSDIAQMQPIIFSIEHGRPTLRIEGISKRAGYDVTLPCWWVLDLTSPEGRKRAKERFAHLEACARAGEWSDARKAYEAGQEAGVYR